MIRALALVLEPIIPCHQIQRPISWQEQFGRQAPLDVEVGFGLGEFLIRSARENPQRDYVGIEQNWERICKALESIAKIKGTAGPRALSNIRILKVDARLAFERLFHPESIEKVYCLFPCPWPKKAHVRHRLFSADFLRLLNSRLKPRGEVKILTDFLAFVQWIEGQIPDTGFQIRRETVKPRYDTKFERKWRREGQEEFSELTLMKERHSAVPLKEDVPLKAYEVKDFHPSRFRLKNQTGDISVIFKDMIFDSAQKRAMIHVVVAEQTLTQHFWIVVFEKERGWRICGADGQNLLPTEGLARALELVYEAAVNSMVNS
ncbi:MAG: hypothetical protein A3D87_07150 [Omnitrophica WOR_2 bacterium RIFCSPHIGHO2_02_FULL_50_17]|nr:MAG: hypothetical protein A3D87_07150 [Omnitrophica WOR_2 bacterium RIFCSPHIGHO2_02_FULL_50_17]